MAKTFYTERDIEDLAAQGAQSLPVDENTVLTELARERARELGIEIVEVQADSSSAPQRSADAPKAQADALPSGAELESRIYNSVKTRLGDQVDETLLRAIVRRVLKNVGS